jgi:hypothetical protein
MLGGVTFMVRGQMCISAGKGRIMCRIDPAIHDAALQRKGCRTVAVKGREYRGYVYVDAEHVRTQGDLEYWVNLALEDNNNKAKSAKKRNRQTRPSRDP